MPSDVIAELGDYTDPFADDDRLYSSVDTVQIPEGQFWQYYPEPVDPVLWCGHLFMSAHERRLSMNEPGLPIPSHWRRSPFARLESVVQGSDSGRSHLRAPVSAVHAGRPHVVAPHSGVRGVPSGGQLPLHVCSASGKGLRASGH